MKKYAFITLILLFPFYTLSAENSPEKISEKNKLLQNEIIKKDEERRAKILKKFTDFQEKVKNFSPDLKLKMPINPDKTDDIDEQNTSSKVKKPNEYYAFAADSYKLRSLPYDSIKEFTASVSRGDKVLVLMKPDVKKDKNYRSITKDWLLIRKGDGTEGYIPLNLILNKKPSGSWKKSGLIYDTDAPSVNCSFRDSLNPRENEGLLILTQYSGDDSSLPKNMKVNTSILKVRSEPSLDSETIYSLNKNETVEVIEYSSHSDVYEGKSSKWAKIRKNDITGWVFGYYLTEVSGSGGDGAGADFTSYLNKGADLYVKPDILRVRDAPDDLSTVLFSLQNKEKVKVTEIESEEVTLAGKKSKWVKIKYLDYDGWVFGAFLSKDKNAFEEGDDINNLFQIPLDAGTYFISSKFGKRLLNGKANMHSGIDLAAPLGTEVHSSTDGTVIRTVIDNRTCGTCGYGSHVIVETKDGTRIIYGHLSEVNTTEGKKVKAGEKIGRVGNTGNSYGCHLHFEIRVNEEAIDPMNYIHP